MEGFPIILDSPLPDIHQPVYEFQEGAFARTVGADEQDRIALFDIEGDVEKDLLVAVPCTGVCDLQQAHTYASITSGAFRNSWYEPKR